MLSAVVQNSDRNEATPYGSTKVYWPCDASGPYRAQIAEPPLIGSDAPSPRTALLRMPTNVQNAASFTPPLSLTRRSKPRLVEGRAATYGEIAVTRRLLAKPWDAEDVARLKALVDHGAICGRKAPSRLDDATSGSITRAIIFFMNRQTKHLTTVLLHN
jgi:hypothetical protein